MRLFEGVRFDHAAVTKSWSTDGGHYRLQRSRDSTPPWMMNTQSISVRPLNPSPWTPTRAPSRMLSTQSTLASPLDPHLEIDSLRSVDSSKSSSPKISRNRHAFERQTKQRQALHSKPQTQNSDPRAPKSPEIDMLRSVKRSNGWHYTVVEVGSSFEVWGVRAVAAYRLMFPAGSYSMVAVESTAHRQARQIN